MAIGGDSDTVTGLISGRALGDRSATALEFGGTSWSFSSLDLEGRRVATGLEALGVRPGDRVALWLPNCPAWLTLYLGCARLGAAVVAVNTRFRSRELADIVTRSGARVLAYWPGFLGIDFPAILDEAAVRGRLDHVIACGPDCTGRPGERGYDRLIQALPRDRDDATPAAGSVVFTTSGTTSAPKFVLHSQRSVVRHARRVASDFGYDASDAVLLQALPLCGVFGFCQAVAALAAGRPSVLMAAFDAAAAVSEIARHSVTHMNGTDDMYRAMLNAGGKNGAFGSMRLAGFAAFNMDAKELDAQARAHGLPLIGLYGMSEVQALFARQHRGDPDAIRIQPGGRMVAPQARARVRDAAGGALLEPGEVGNLELSGPSLMTEYLGDPDATRAAMTEDGYVRTGDLAMLRPDGGFTFVARSGDALRLGGFLVAPAEIEGVLNDMPEVRASQVVGANEGGDPCAVAFVVAEPGAGFDEEDLRSRCAARVARFKVPRRIVRLDAFPVVDGANGRKIQRSVLRDMAQALVGTP